MTFRFVALHWLDLDMTSGEPWRGNPCGSIVGCTEGPVPVIRFYGVTNAGTSIMLSVHGFTPYFYVSLPSSFDLNDAFMGALRSALDQRVSSFEYMLLNMIIPLPFLLD
jgi:DNA polymerase elongation subunit (family B)